MEGDSSQVSALTREERREHIRRMKRKRVIRLGAMAAGLVILIVVVVLVIGAIERATAVTPVQIGPYLPGENDQVVRVLKVYDYSAPVPENDAATDSYFAKTVFVGDARVAGLCLFGQLPGAKFLYSENATVDTAVNGSLTDRDGQKTDLVTALKDYGSERVYLMFGLNELGWVYNEVFLEGYAELVDLVKATLPEADIYIQAVIPVTAASESSHAYITNAKIAANNAELQKLAAEKKVYYVDTAAALSGGSSALPDEMSSGGVALATDSYAVWFQYLKTHTVNKELYQ